LRIGGALLLESALGKAVAVERYTADPPLATILRTPALEPPIRTDAPSAGATAPLVAGGASVDFVIQYTSAKIYNPATDRFDNVELRSYRDARELKPPSVPFVAPTLQLLTGETARITLRNHLPVQPDCVSGRETDPLKCSNRTNLHSHGLWVNPSGNGDNVLLTINPNVDFQYEYNVPFDHPAGTFWYHPHRHGSTALQVASGMAGVLVVKGARPPTPQSPGDIDTVLKDASGAPFAERVVLLQQIQYACRDANGQIKQDANGRYLCDSSDVGRIEQYDQFGPTTWPKSGRYTSINGEVTPTFPDAIAGRIERWRVVHAGVRETVLLQFRKMRDNTEPYANVGPDQQGDWIARNCPGPDLLPQLALASDGLTRSQIVERMTSVLQPGYREDFLIVFPQKGKYCVLDDAAQTVGTVNAETKSRKFLGKVEVRSGRSVGDVKKFVLAQLVAAAQRAMPLAVRKKVVDDLLDGLRLTSFVPHPDIRDEEIRPPQREVIFEISRNGFTIDGKSYDPARIDQTLPLGVAEEWKLSAVNAVGHPFHIHVNPFQIQRIVNNTTNADVSVAGATDDPQYAGLKGVWKDTLFVKIL
jgi:FtsP/CotA-like multicopper oxidase with cupredoxin domain